MKIKLLALVIFISLFSCSTDETIQSAEDIQGDAISNREDHTDVLNDQIAFVAVYSDPNITIEEKNDIRDAYFAYYGLTDYTISLDGSHEIWYGPTSSKNVKPSIVNSSDDDPDISIAPY